MLCKFLFSLLLLSIAASTYAADVTLTWQNPTQYDDGTPLDPTDIVSRRIQWTGDCPNFGYVSTANDFYVDGGGNSVVVQNVSPGSRCFRVAVVARTVRCAITTAENCLRESAWSNVWSQRVADEPASVAAKTPNAPTNLSGN